MNDKHNGKIGVENQNSNSKKIMPLNGVKLWLNRFKYKKSIIIIVYIIFGISIILNILMRGSYEYMEKGILINDIFIVTAYSFCLYLGVNMISNIQELLESTVSAFDTEIIYKDYEKSVIKTFNSKFELILPISAAAFYSISSFLYDPEQHLSLGIIPLIQAICTSIFTFFSVLFVLSTLILIILSFKCVNKLGTERYPLDVSYKDLQIGTLNNIGKFMISVTVPIIIFATIFSILGSTFIRLYLNIKKN